MKPRPSPKVIYDWIVGIFLIGAIMLGVILIIVDSFYPPQECPYERLANGECPGFTCMKNPAVCWSESVTPMLDTNVSNHFISLSNQEKPIKWYVAEKPANFIILDKNGTEIPRCGT